MVFPGSHQFHSSGKWIIAATFLETNRLYALTVSNVEVNWIIESSNHLSRRSWSNPRWQKKSGQVVADEKITLFGLILSADRIVNFGRTAKKFNDLKLSVDHAHNTILQIAVELGLVGLAAFLWLFGSVFYNGFKYYFYLQRKNEKAILILGILCGIGALFIHGLITHFYKHESFYTLWVIVALLFALIEGDVEKSHSSYAPAVSAR